MALRKVRVMGDEVLNQVCKEVKEITPRTMMLIEDMLDTMYDSNGVGLAAPQVGILKQIVVMDVDDGNQYVLINPEIISAEGEQCGSEGCLSVPGVYAEVRRPSVIKVEYYNENLEKVVEVFDRFACRMVQHELSHLEGNLFVDNVSPIRRKMIARKLQAISKGAVQTRYKSKR